MTVFCASRIALATVAVLSLGPIHNACAQTAPTVTDTFSVLTNDSANDGNFATGVILYEGANITQASGQIYGYIKQGTTVLSLVSRPDTFNPNLFGMSIPYDSALTGQWAFHASSQSSTANFASGLTQPLPLTPLVGSTVGVMPFVQSMTITADPTGLSPSFSWVLPTTPFAGDPTGNPMPSVSNINISVSDNTSTITRTYLNPFAPNFGKTFQQADVIYTSGGLGASATTFTIPTINDNVYNANHGLPLLQYGHTYSVDIQLDHSNGGTVPGCLSCNTNSRSNSYFDYTPIDTSNTPYLPPGSVINLPTAKPIPTTSGLTSSVLYQFNVAAVGPSSGMTFIDPVVATGFIYTVGANDPLFAGVKAITGVGNGIYQLSVWNSLTNSFDLIDSSFAVGTTFDFLSHGYANGVSEFEITGIDPGAGLDPTDITAFITGLTFMSDGSFTGTMQAITADAPASVPEPGTLPLLLSGLGALGIWRWRSRASRKLVKA